MANPAAAILNPKEDCLLLFLVDDKRRLTLSQIPVDSSKQSVYYKHHDTPQGIHVTNQCIVTTHLGGLPVVYGKIHNNDNKLVLARLSPITHIVAREAEDVEKTTTDFAALAAVSNSDTGDKDDTAWFYYLRQPDPKKPVRLMEAELSYDKLSVDPVGSLKAELYPNEKSRLAAIYLKPNIREVFYQTQGVKSDIYCLKIGSHVDAKQIVGTSTAMMGTPMAVVKSKSGAVYLYYLNTAAEVQRVARVGGEWGTPIAMAHFGSLTAQKETQIAAVHSVEEGQLCNYVFFINDDEKTYKSNKDKLNIV
ncbi:hypothetical protein FNAPI_11621 [Fusarium napiforme]|uniref:Fucose-specific lectin n=1 Tax=Fusarium napiforme TaxID=42672 RepID=A0A8H5IJ25_9HYPO|nr:hypothetical protein FNAPI_11621 [Fusarium napiforme]